MKTSITSFDLRLLVAEWQGLVGGHVDKIYQRDDEVMFRVNTSDRGKVELYSKAGRWLCLHTVEDKPEAPPPFAQTLRRLLDNARVTSVEQRGLDRIAVFRVERGPERFDVVFEVFTKGNLVLVRDGTIVAVMSPQKFKDRAVQVAEPYAYPAAGIDPLELDRGGFANALKGAKGQVVRILATVMNLGGTYAEELCLRAGVDKEIRVQDLQDPQIDSLYTSLNNIAVAIDQERRPAVILQAGRAIDATPIELVQYGEAERKEFPTFNEALNVGNSFRSASPYCTSSIGVASIARPAWRITAGRRSWSIATAILFREVYRESICGSWRSLTRISLSTPARRQSSSAYVPPRFITVARMRTT